MIPRALALALLLLPPPPAGQGIGAVTLLEGSLRVIRGTSVFQGAEGMNVRQGDIIESSEGGFVQLEFANGAIVALGPASRLYVFQYATGEASSGQTVALDLVMLNGWLKGESTAGKRLYRYRSPMLVITTTGGAVVVRSNQNACDVFVESGSASISEVNQSGNSRQTITAKVGQFVSRQKGADATSLPRPSPTFREAVPQQFRDTLPSRLAHFAGKSIEPKTEHPVSYEEIQPWLTIPSAWRRGFAERFAPRLTDPAFRKQIELHVGEYPEWEPILHPKRNSESPQVRN